MRRLAASIIGTRADFAHAFRTAQANLGRRPVEFEAIVRGQPDAVSAYATAFLRARDDGWIDDLCFECLKARITDGDFVKAAAAVSRDGRLAPLQQVTDPNLGFNDGGTFGIWLSTAVESVCRIEIDGSPVGTGFLISDHHVMTAYHVVKSLLDAGDKEQPGSAARLRLRFDFKKKPGQAGQVELSDGIVYRVATPWLVACSPCTKEEILEGLPDDEDQLKDYWDFAVIQLAELPGLRPRLEVARQFVARGHRLTILQHPKGRPVAWSQNVVRRFLGKSDRFRIVHIVNTEDGSSGSPCLNDDFKVVGLHQAAMPVTRPPRNGDAADVVKENRAVPMSLILNFWDPAAAAAPPAIAVANLLTVNTATQEQHPVFGRGRLQEWIAKSAHDAGAGKVPDRFLAVAGHKGAGKTFTIDVLRMMLPRARHVVVECRASEFNTESSAVSFAKRYLLDPIGADASRLPGLAQAHTSDNAWLTYHFVGDLLSVMDKARKGRMFWLALDELDQVVLPDQGQVRRLLDLLYTRAEQNPWLRFLLIGLEGVPVPGLTPLTQREFVGVTSQADLARDVGDYLVRRLEARGYQNIEPIVRGHVVTEIPTWLAACNGRLDHPDLLRTAVDSVIRFEQSLKLRPTQP